MTDPIEQKAEEAWLEFDDESDERVMIVAEAFSALFKAGYRTAAEEMEALREYDRRKTSHIQTLARDVLKVCAERDEALEALRKTREKLQAYRDADARRMAVEAHIAMNRARGTSDVSTSPTGVRQTTPSEILKSKRGREAVEKTADLGYEGSFR